MKKSTQHLLDEFYRASKRRPCPICERPDWCLIAKDGTTAICARSISDEQWGDAGYIHKLADPIPKYTPPPREQIVSYIAWNTDAMRFAAAITLVQLTDLARSLGVTTHSLYRLMTGWDARSGSFTNPMSDGDDVIGIRLRKPDGFKFAVTGSQNGLFIPRDLSGDGPLLIVEGASDTAACLDMEFDGIGRPSCSSCVDMTAGFVASVRNREWVIIEDHDEPKKRPGGTEFFPGQDGARKLAEVLVKIKPGKVVAAPKCKDVREWRQRGATRNNLLNLIKNAEYVPCV